MLHKDQRTSMPHKIECLDTQNWKYTLADSREDFLDTQEYMNKQPGHWRCDTGCLVHTAMDGMGRLELLRLPLKQKSID